MSAFLRNCWYLAAWADEIEHGKPFARTILNEAIVFFRMGESVIALLDRCPHRFAPLSRGTVTDMGIVCAYHGLTFGSEGHCIANPHGAASRSARTTAYPVAEKHAGVWIWMGDPLRADPDRIPDMSFIDDAPPATRVKGVIHTEANYLLVVDNIMDLTHTDTLHPTTLGGGAISRVKPDVIEADKGVTVRWRIQNEPASPAFDKYMPSPGHPTETVRQSHVVLPAVATLTGNFQPIGCSPDQNVKVVTAHVMTPETEMSTHYFYCNTRNYGLDDDKLSRDLAGLISAVFVGEDKPMIEAQQQRMGTADFDSLNPALIGTDKGPVLFRRLLEKEIQTEAAGSIA